MIKRLKLLKRFPPLQFNLLILGVFATSVSAFGGSAGYHMVGKFAVPVKSGDLGWDNIRIDSNSKRLYVAHGERVEVIDSNSGRLIGEVLDTPDVHDIAVVPALGKGFATNAHADTVTVFDLQTFAHKREIKVGHKPDAAEYDPLTRRLYVTNTGSNDIQSIDPETEEVVATSALGDATENIAFDDKGNIWAILEKTHVLVTLQGETLKVNRKIPLPGCTAPSGMAIDQVSRRVFIGCRSRILLIVDADKGQIISKFPIGEHIDATIFDPESQLIFTSTGDGNITIVQQQSPNKYTLVQTVKTMRGAKTMARDSVTGKLFLPTVEDVPLRFSGAPDPVDTPYTPGRFVIVVVDKDVAKAPLNLVDRIPVPGVTEFDHVGVDAKNSRLFSCAEVEGKIEVVDLQSKRVIHEITGLQRPHSIVYRENPDLICVVDGSAKEGAVKIYDGKDYRLVRNVSLPPGADWSTDAGDPTSKYMYVTASGDVRQQELSTVSIVDTDTAEKVADIQVKGATIGGVVADFSSARLYLGNKNEKNEIDVIDLDTRQVIAVWPLTIGKKPGPLFLDAKAQRLYVGCRSGSLVIFDTSNGKELQALVSSPGADDISYDKNSRRLYINGSLEGNRFGGTIDVYQQGAPDEYKSLGQVVTGRGARNGTLIPELSKYVVEIPPSPGRDAEILIYDVQ